jgi:hypothetical protein
MLIMLIINKAGVHAVLAAARLHDLLKNNRMQVYIGVYYVSCCCLCA